MKKVPDILKGGQKIVEKSIKQELRDQGHYLTGALERSIAGDVINDNELDGTSLDYLLKLDTGIPASQIVINSQALAEMTAYVEKRFGYRGKKAAGVAYLILKRQAKEGNPTKNSAQFSKTGERKAALKNGFKKAEPELDEYILSGVDEIMNELFTTQKTETL